MRCSNPTHRTIRHSPRFHCRRYLHHHHKPIFHKFLNLFRCLHRMQSIHMLHKNHRLVNHEAISAAKGGIEAMVRSAAATYANRGIRVNAVAPGLTDTKIASPIMSNETASQAASQKIPIKRVGKKEEIASVIKWLLVEAP